MRRYRMSAFTSRQALKYAERVLPRLGKIKSVKAYRFTSTQTQRWRVDGQPQKGSVHTSREYLLVVGENGSARFNGVCWGYGGEGPRTTHAILTKCGVDKPTADMLAYDSRRLDKDGMSWNVHI